MLLVIPFSLSLLMALAGFLALGLLGVTLYILILKPAREALADTLSPPPREGSEEEITITTGRIRTMGIGQIDSDFKTRMHGIKEDHLVIKLRRDPEVESYTISLSPGGPVFYRAPHQKTFELMSGAESFESSELIGHPAVLRLAALVRDHRPIQFVEFEMSTRFYINNSGEEKMKFLLKINKIYPSIDLDSRDKRGVFLFGRLKREGPEDADSAAA
ncbi:MAG: hypothetical protein HS115_05725 [Spirochaetales bacterium]|nr:hypothetical protein [Spirochaetales bacterium]